MFSRRTSRVTTTQNVGNSQNNSLSMSAKEAYKIADEAYKAKDYAKALYINSMQPSKK